MRDEAEPGEIVFFSRRRTMAATVVKRLEFPKGGEFVIVVHDLLEEPVDCIVNAANGGLSHGGGVAAAIAMAAGPELDMESGAIVRERGWIPTGEAVVTTAGKLPFKGVIHTVGPRKGEGDEEKKLVRAIRSAFLRAHERGWRSLSFPGVSSGIFAVPHDVCARAYLQAVQEFFQQHPDSSLKTVRLCLLKGRLLEVVKQTLRA
jgi:putative ATPase